MEDQNLKKLKTLIEALTHSGSTTLDEEIFSQVKKICKSSQAYIQHAYEVNLKQLNKKNAQVRFIAFQICKELFSRSGAFRELLIKDIQLIFELTAEINPVKKLPPPKSHAKMLKALALSTLKKWVDEYGETYKQLKIAYKYLEKWKQANFETLELRNSAEQIVENEHQQRLRAINNERLKKLMDEVSNNKSEIEMTITSLSNCLSLLLPTLEDFFISENDTEKTSTVETKIRNENINNTDGEVVERNHENGESDLRQFGVFANYNLSIQVDLNKKIKIVTTEENNSVIENAEDCVRLINNRFLPMVKKWCKIYCKYSDGVSNNSELKNIIDLKEKLQSILKKYYSLNIESKNRVVDNENSSDDEFEEVKKEGYEDSVNFSEEELVDIPSINETGVKPQSDKSNHDSTSDLVKVLEEQDINAAGTSGLSSKSQETCRKKRLMAIAPKLPFDIDLYHWEDEHLTTPTLISTKIDVDKFWGTCSSDEIHEIPNPEGLAALRTRVIEFSGKFEPVKWTCRAPLKNGKLCPRRDRFKCPFHGKIVARDETGKCQNENSEASTSQTAGTYDKAEWQDPELLNDLKEATGVDLKMPEKRGKRLKTDKKNLTHKKMKTSMAALRILESKKLPGLVDVVRKQNNAYTRLKKKIFNRSSLKRVSSALNRLDRNKYHDKFGDQFNYT